MSSYFNRVQTDTRTMTTADLLELFGCIKHFFNGIHDKCIGM